MDAFNLDPKRTSYRQNWQVADSVWNITGSGGSNRRCLQAYPKNESWKCLMAQYILPHLETPVFVMNSAYDLWQLPNILGTNCIAQHKCTPQLTTSIQEYAKNLSTTVMAALATKTGSAPSG